MTSVGVNGGDLTWQEPAPFLISLAEVYVASLCASIPFFWPIIAQQINKIMVMYEFNVSSESRYKDDEVELANTESWLVKTKSASSRDDGVSMKSGSRGKVSGPTTKTTHYTDDFVQNHVNPFSEEFRVETTARSASTRKKKGGFVRFDNKP